MTANTRRALTPAQAILYGGLVAAVLDILVPIIFYGVQGTPPLRILQSVASGLLGSKASVAGGWPTGLLGLGLHTAIMLVFAAAYVIASRFAPILARRWPVFGPLYGLGVYGVMNYVVVPLSAIHGKPPHVPLTIAMLLFAHMVLVGPTIAFFASRTAVSRG